MLYGIVVSIILAVLRSDRRGEFIFVVILEGSSVRKRQQQRQWRAI
jgi:hypothetical protein